MWQFTLLVIMFKGALQGLKQFLITESPLKIMKNAFYFNLKAFFVLNISKSWLRNNCNTHISQYLKT